VQNHQLKQKCTPALFFAQLLVLNCRLISNFDKSILYQSVKQKYQIKNNFRSKFHIPATHTKLAKFPRCSERLMFKLSAKTREGLGLRVKQRKWSGQLQATQHSTL
jgi:hypothetical protein